MVIELNLEEVLYKYFNYSSFRGPQKTIIEHILNKEDTLTILPTGMGKSIIYQIPGLMLDGLVVVVSPLIALMKDQVSNLKKRKIKASFISKDLSFNEINDIYKNKDKLKFLYVSAERLENISFISNIKDISLLVIDEAHTIKWGAGFRKSLYHINNFINKLNKRPIIACFTATLNKNDIRLVIEKTGLIKPYITNYLPIKDNLKYIVYKNKRDYNLNKLLKNNIKTIVYTLTRYKALVLHMKYKGSYIYHGLMSSKDKNKNYLGFKNSNNGLIFATNAFGMGIDIKDIRRVIIYDLPINLSDLVQQAGRAGRDNLPSVCYILYDDLSVKTALHFIYNGNNIKEELKELDKIVKFCFVNDKIKFIIDYFKEN